MAHVEAEATILRISKQPGVLGCIVVNKDGAVLRSTCEAEVTKAHAQLIPDLAALARNMVRDLDPQNELEFLRIRSRKHEIMVAPNPDFVLIAIQETRPETAVPPHPPPRLAR